MPPTHKHTHTHTHTHTQSHTHTITHTHTYNHTHTHTHIHTHTRKLTITHTHNLTCGRNRSKRDLRSNSRRLLCILPTRPLATLLPHTCTAHCPTAHKAVCAIQLRYIHTYIHTYIHAYVNTYRANPRYPTANTHKVLEHAAPEGTDTP